MPKKNFYAVLNGRVPGIYETWSECQKQTDQFPKCKFKSFFTLSEAEDYMKGDDQNIPPISCHLSKQNFYVVIKGRVPGIYPTWTECQKQIDKFPGCKHKSFSTLAEAEAYIEENKAFKKGLKSKFSNTEQLDNSDLIQKSKTAERIYSDYESDLISKQDSTDDELCLRSLIFSDYAEETMSTVQTCNEHDLNVSQATPIREINPQYYQLTSPNFPTFDDRQAFLPDPDSDLDLSGIIENNLDNDSEDQQFYCSALTASHP